MGRCVYGKWMSFSHDDKNVGSQSRAESRGGNLVLNASQYAKTSASVLRMENDAHIMRTLYVCPYYIPNTESISYINSSIDACGGTSLSRYVWFSR